MRKIKQNSSIESGWRMLAPDKDCRPHGDSWIICDDGKH